MNLSELIEAQDMNGLLRAIDALCERRDWEELISLAERCEDALERGKQLWPIAEHVDYRLVLEAPGEIAADVLHPGVGRFSPGPLTEVIASTHEWEELADHIDDPGLACYVAQERVLRGEDLRGDERAHPEVLEMPMVLLPWEPPHRLATYAPTHVEVQEPWEPDQPLAPADAIAAEELDEPLLVQGLLDLVTPWVNESNGAAQAVVVEGGALGAIGALNPGPARIARLEPKVAMQTISWAAASGGARGRRRGAALGRSMSFYLASSLTDLGWPCDPGELGPAIEELVWYRWDEGEPEEGWVLRLAIEDARNGWAAAVAATDLLDDEDEESG